MNLWWRCLIGGLAVAGGALAALPRADAETFPLELKRVEARGRSASFDAWDQLFRYVGPQHFFMQMDKNGDRVQNGEPGKEFSKVVKKEPEKYNSKHPMRAVAMLGSHDYALVLDDKEAESGKYDRLWFDKNHNGDLTDDEPIEAKESGNPASGYAQSVFPRVEVTVEADGASHDYAFLFTAHANMRQKDFQYVSASLNAAVYREGEITLEGKTHRIVVLDYNSNGRFGDEAKIRDDVQMSDGKIYAQPGDMLLVDPSQAKMGYAYYRPTASKIHQFFSKLVNLDGAFYDVSLSPAGDQITLTPSPLALGQVSNPHGPFHAIVYGEHGFVKLSGDGTNPVKLPEGEWKLLGYTIDLTQYPAAGEEAEDTTNSLLKKLVDVLTGNMSGPGIRYTVLAATATRDYAAVKVTKDATVPLPFGPPYKPIVKVGYRQADDKVQLQMSLVGSAGEICEDMRVEGRQPGTPEFTVADPDGKVVESGTFEYG
jgi:hypothetical protein